MIDAIEDRPSRANRWRLLVWGVPAILYAIPVVAKLTVPDMLWTAFDFIVWAVMLLTAAGLCELLMRMAGNAPYRVASGLAVAGLFLLVWISLAVGIIGDEDNVANLMYAGVIALGFAGAFIAHGRPRGMSNTMFAVAAAQVIVAVVAVAGGMGVGNPIWPMDVVGATGILTGIWLLSGGLFRVSANQ